jgi:hypothetical protein
VEQQQFCWGIYVTEIQGEQQAVTSFFDAIKAFKTKLRPWKGQLNSGNSTHFSMCQDYRKSRSNF